MLYKEDIRFDGNFAALMRCGGKVVQGSRREGHNVFTSHGRAWLAKLMGWATIASTDVPYTNRRVRWIGVGSGSQLESSNVANLAIPLLATTTNYLLALDSVEFPTSSTVRFIKEFRLSDITTTGAPVRVSEMALFTDVSPAVAGVGNDGLEDVPYEAGVVDTILNPSIGVNPPVAYKAFEALTKTVDFTLEVRWDFRIS